MIGKGDGIVPLILEYLLPDDCHVDTFDIDESLRPTIVGDVRHLSEAVRHPYDCVICCEVLEHLEWKYFEPILQEFQKVCTKRLILSLPLRALPFEIWVNFPKFRNRKWSMMIQRTWIRELPWEGAHYWEVGIKNKTKADMLKIFNKYFDVEENYVKENSFHWFVIMKAKNA